MWEEMVIQLNVFSGSFADEISQRFLKIMTSAGTAAFEDLYQHSMPRDPPHYRRCLARVRAWDPSVTKDELESTRRACPDVEMCFKHTFVNYVKAMRGGKNVRLTVSVPALRDVFAKFLEIVAQSTQMQNGSYYRNSNILEQRAVCLDALRDTLFEFLGDEYVMLNRDCPMTRKQVESCVSSSSCPSNSVREVATASEIGGDANVERRPSSSRDHDRNVAARHVDDAAPVSDPAMPSTTNTPDCVAAPQPNSSQVGAPDDETSFDIGPDDSVSNADFATKQQEQMARYKKRCSVDDDPSVTDGSSRTSLSLSSISISQSGLPTREERRVDGTRKGGVDRSYVTSLTDRDDE